MTDMVEAIADTLLKDHMGLMAENNSLREQLSNMMAVVASVEKERDALSAEVTAWEEKAAAWMASPEAVKRLEGYRELAQQLNKALMELDEARCTVRMCHEEGIRKLAACQTEALYLRKALIKWRQKEWPGTDQAAVINKEFPFTSPKNRLK